MTTLPHSGKLSIPVKSHRPGSRMYTLIQSPQGRQYCFRADLATALIKKGWLKVTEINELPF